MVVSGKWFSALLANIKLGWKTLCLQSCDINCTSNSLHHRGLYYKKHYGFVIYGFRSKLMFVQAGVFFKPVNVTDNRNDSSLLQNLSIFL